MLQAEEAELRAQCLVALEKTVAKYFWQGRWNEDEVVDEILAEVARRQLLVSRVSQEKLITDAAVNCYSRRWHAACGKDRTIEQHEAFDALGRYIFRIVLPEVNGNEAIAQDTTQNVLISIFNSLNTVRDVGAFIFFVRQTALRQVWRDREHEKKDSGEPLNEDTMEPDEKAGDVSPDDDTDSVEANLRRELEEVIRRCLRRSPDRQKVIIDALLNGRSIKDIAEEMGKRPNTVAVLKNRAIEQLQQCKDLLDYKEKMENKRSSDDTEMSKAVQYFFRVLNGETDGMSCEECRSWLPTYVEAEVSGFNAAEQYPDVKQHLDLCRSCENEYISLLESSMQEQEEASPANQQTPPFDLSFLPTVSVRTYFKALLQDVMRRQLPQRVAEIEDGIDLFLRRMELLGDLAVPRAVAVAGPERTFDQLHLATYDALRSVLEQLESRAADAEIDRTELTQLVQAAAQKAAEQQQLGPEQRSTFVATVTESVIRSSALVIKLRR